MKYWETIAANLKEAGFSVGWISAVDSEGRTICIADTHSRWRLYAGKRARRRSGATPWRRLWSLSARTAVVTA